MPDGLPASPLELIAPGLAPFPLHYSGGSLVSMSATGGTATIGTTYIVAPPSGSSDPYHLEPGAWRSVHTPTPRSVRAMQRAERVPMPPATWPSQVCDYSVLVTLVGLILWRRFVPRRVVRLPMRA